MSHFAATLTAAPRPLPLPHYSLPHDSLPLDRFHLTAVAATAASAPDSRDHAAYSAQHLSTALAFSLHSYCLHCTHCPLRINIARHSHALRFRSLASSHPIRTDHCNVHIRATATVTQPLRSLNFHCRATATVTQPQRSLNICIHAAFSVALLSVSLCTHCCTSHLHITFRIRCYCRCPLLGVGPVPLLLIAVRCHRSHSQVTFTGHYCMSLLHLLSHQLCIRTSHSTHRQLSQLHSIPVLLSLSNPTAKTATTSAFLSYSRFRSNLKTSFRSAFTAATFTLDSAPRYGRFNSHVSLSHSRCSALDFTFAPRCICSTTALLLLRSAFCRSAFASAQLVTLLLLSDSRYTHVGSALRCFAHVSSAPPLLNVALILPRRH